MLQLLLLLSILSAFGNTVVVAPDNFATTGTVDAAACGVYHDNILLIVSIRLKICLACFATIGVAQTCVVLAEDASIDLGLDLLLQLLLVLLMIVFLRLVIGATATALMFCWMLLQLLQPAPVLFPLVMLLLLLLL